MEGRVEPPTAPATLGWELLAVDPDAGTIEVAFRAAEALLNPVGVIQGGFPAAMLDDTLGPARTSASCPATWPTRRGAIVATATATAQIRRQA